VPTSAHPEADALDTRYGQARTRRRFREGRLIVIFVAAFVVLFGAWAIWAGYGSTSSTLGEDVVGTSIDNAAGTVTVRFTVSVDPGTAFHCAVEAQSEDHSIVGWKVVGYPATTQRQTDHEETVRTVSPAVTGLINSCWVD